MSMDGIDRYFLKQANAMDAAYRGEDADPPPRHPFQCRPRALGRLSFWRAVTAELVGTCMLVFFGTFSTIGLQSVPGNGNLMPEIISISFTFGLIVMAMAYSFGHVSGGHLNPAVTLGVVIAGGMDALTGLFYWIAQVGGAVAGSGLLYALIHYDVQGNLGLNTLNPNVTPVQGLFIEVIMTYVLVQVVLSTTDAHRPMFSMAPLVIGLTVGVCHIIGVPSTGTSINPARALGPAIVGMNFEDYLWIYIVGPFVGAIIAGVLYRFWFKPYRCSVNFDDVGNGHHKDFEMRE